MDFKKIEEALNFLHNNKGELEAYDRKLDEERSRLSQLETAEEKGSLKRASEIAVQLLDVLDVATIAKKTGLTIDQVEELKKQAK